MIQRAPRVAVVLPVLLALLTCAAWLILPTPAAVIVTLTCLAVEVWFTSASWSWIGVRQWNAFGVFWALLIASTFAPHGSLVRAMMIASAVLVGLLGARYALVPLSPRNKREDA